MGNANTEGNINKTGTQIKSYNGYLGYGYDVIDKRYYNSNDVANSIPVLDTRKLAADGLIFQKNISSNDVDHIVGMKASDYESKLSVKAGLDYKSMCFKASFNSSFTSAKNVSSTESFVKTMITIGQSKEYINLSYVSLNDLKKYVTDTFKNDVNNSRKNAKDILTTYGTHVLLDIKLGGRMELNYMYHNEKQCNENTLSLSASAVYKGITAKASSDFSKDAKDFYEDSQFSASQLGGTVTANITSLEKAQDAYDVWTKSLVGSNPRLEFVDAGDLNNPYALLPIWQLAENQQRSKEIETEYYNLLNQNGQYFNNLQTEVVFYVKDIYLGDNSHDKKDAAKSDLLTKIQNGDPNLNHVILDYDLNSSAKGDWIYLGYTLTSDRSKAIKGLMLERSKHNNLPDRKDYNGVTYTRTGFDLTKGTGGDYFIYLYYTKDDRAGEPLKALGIEFNANNFTFLGSDGWKGWSAVGTFGGISKLDVNSGAGGKYIYIWQKR
jgi:hypothetical protein